MYQENGRDLRSIAIIGAGTIGKAHAEVAAKTFESLEQIVLFDLNPSSAESLASTLRSSIHTKVEIQVAKTARDSVHGSDAVIAATTVTSGYIPYDWLLPSCIFVNVSLDDLLPEVFLKADLLVVDDWNLIQADSKRLLGKMYRERRIVGPKDTSSNGATRRVDAEIGDLVLGRHPGRRKAEDIIVINPFGLAIEDIAFASKVLEVAKSRNIGTLLPV
ncbi:MAG: saccharopine dehydrogenase NADP-binding domain-containing protein [Candidatus Sulfotelmatobacter sp.]